MNVDDGLLAEPGAEGRRSTGADAVESGMRLRLARQARGFSATAGHHGRRVPPGRLCSRGWAVRPFSAGGAGALEIARAHRGGDVRPGHGRAESRGAPAGTVETRAVAGVSLAQVGDAFVVAPLSGAAATRTGFVPAGGFADEWAPKSERQRGRSGLWAPTRPTLVVAGCDPALPLLEVPLGLLDPPVSLLWWQCASQEALELAANGLVHAAGSHLRDQSGDYNVGQARQQFRQGADVVRFCAWREGLVLRPDMAAQHFWSRRRSQGRPSSGQPPARVRGPPAA